jgi:hypothetical protein
MFCDGFLIKQMSSGAEYKFKIVDFSSHKMSEESTRG